MKLNDIVYVNDSKEGTYRVLEVTTLSSGKIFPTKLIHCRNGKDS
jgi:hypothetical protein